MLRILVSIVEEEYKFVCLNVRWVMRNKFKRGEVIVDANRLLGCDKVKDDNFV